VVVPFASSDCAAGSSGRSLGESKKLKTFPTDF
jgi:hypothetical protein